MYQFFTNQYIMINKKLFGTFEKKTSGYLAGTLTSLAFLPQVFEVYKTKSTKGLSFSSLVIFFIGQILWIIHGSYFKDYSITIFALITGILYILLIYAKFKYH